MGLHSVTITPPDRCQELLHQIARRLPREDAALIGERFQPHITLQMIYDVHDVGLAQKVLRRVCAATRPMGIHVSSTPSLLPRTNAEARSLGVEVEKTRELGELYRRLQAEFSTAGFRTSEFTLEEWLPHLTLIYVNEPPEGQRVTLLYDVIAQYQPCSFVASSLELNRLDDETHWVELDSFSLSEQGSTSRHRP